MFDEPVEAAIFDMDGTLIDSETVYMAGMQDAARTLGLDLPIALCHAMVGLPRPECNLLLQQHFGADFDLATFRGHYVASVQQRMSERVPIKPGVVELLDFLADRGLPLAIATSANRETAERNLGRAGLLARFRVVSTRDDAKHAKPAPDIYLVAAQRLDVAPAHCVAFEDSSIGIIAAHAAGMRAVMIPDMLPPTEEARAKSLHIVEDLHEVLRRLKVPAHG
jgi:HAD superfamily hydrolase (TIGR01509 family)